MSFFDDASLVFLPSGQAGKDGKAYSMKPTNGDGDFTFSRGSNLTATRVDSNGLIEKGRENLLLQSNQFDTTWRFYDVSVTSGQSGYDGSTDAWLLDISGGTSGQRIEQSMSFGGIQTFSVYAKAGTLNWIRMRGSSNTYFDLANGVIGADGHIDSKIESIGNGWYRCSVVTETSTLARIYLATDDGNVTQSSGSIYIQDAQLEQGLVATEYIESGATTGKAGLLEQEPRFDYSGGASCPSLLLEPSRTQLVNQSEYITDGTNITAVNNDTQSPEGLVNATRFRLGVDESATRHRKLFTLSATSGEDYSFSVFFKEADAQWIQLLAQTTNGVFDIQSYVNFDLQNGVKGNIGTSVVDSGIEDYGNGWYRCYMVATAQATATGYLEILTTNNTDSGRYPSYENTTAINYCYVFGAQIEEGSYPTSYIPNHSGGSVTREADVCGGAGTSSTFNDDEGVLYLEASAIDNGSSEKAIAINDGTTNNRINIRIVNNTIKGLVILGGSLVCNISYTATSVITSNKIAFKYKRDDFALWVNGVEVGTDTSGSTFTADTLNELSFDYGGTSAFFYGNVEQVLYFPSILTDTELATLTS
jgi:hypothetical protein